MKAMHYAIGKATPCIFTKWDKDGKVVAMVTVHGDDFVHVGRASEAGKFMGDMSRKYEIETQQAGPGSRGKELTVLNRKIVWKDDCLEYHPDNRHVERIINDTEANKFRRLSAPI